MFDTDRAVTVLCDATSAMRATELFIGSEKDNWPALRIVPMTAFEAGLQVEGLVKGLVERDKQGIGSGSLSGSEVEAVLWSANELIAHFLALKHFLSRVGASDVAQIIARNDLATADLRSLTLLLGR
ncbi:MAG: hypothetical protein Q8K20_03995 [Gemmobacter sp.]|nr:hypothetical protein [Gemmobacter sp.]